MPYIIGKDGNKFPAASKSSSPPVQGKETSSKVVSKFKDRSSICEKCGIKIDNGKRGPKRVMCIQCRYESDNAKRAIKRQEINETIQRTPKHCRVCHIEIPNPRRGQVYCSPECREHGAGLVNIPSCAHCGKPTDLISNTSPTPRISKYDRTGPVPRPIYKPPSAAQPGYGKDASGNLIVLFARKMYNDFCSEECWYAFHPNFPEYPHCIVHGCTAALMLKHRSPLLRHPYNYCSPVHWHASWCNSNGLDPNITPMRKFQFRAAYDVIPTLAIDASSLPTIIPKIGEPVPGTILNPPISQPTKPKPTIKVKVTKRA